MHSFKLWTESETNLLIRLKKDFVTNKKIASTLNRSLSSVRNKILEIRRHTEIESLQIPWTDSEVKKLIDLKNRKVKLRKIALVLNRSQCSCREKYKRL